jgi:hypothetical protein
MFMGPRSILHPNWEHGVAQTDLHRLQPLLEIIQGLMHKRLTAEEILWTFFNRAVQSLRQREVAVRVSPGPGYLVHPSFTRLGGVEINTRVPEALVPVDSARREACRACSERL